MQQSFPFGPRSANLAVPAAQANLAVGTAAATLTLPGMLANNETAAEATIRVHVDGSQPIAWCWGNNANLTYANGVSMLGNSVETFSVPGGISQMSFIALAAGSTVRVILGDGI